MALNVKLIFGVVDKATSVVRRIRQALRSITQRINLDRLKTSLDRVTRAAWDVAGSLGRVAGVASLLGGAAVWGFKSQLVDVAAQFERFEAILTTIEGSSEKARKSMDWVSDFAAKTPYELDEVMAAFVKLRAYGFEPTKGLLRALGDTSAAMGKNLMDAVEAIADAVTGENERLKEFGVRASVQGSKIVYEYTIAGKQMRSVAEANSRAQIEAVLMAIFNKKYAGAMDKLSSTWDGMISNLSDGWTRFRQMIMSSGVFDWLKNRLQQILDQVNAMAADGTLLAWAQQIAASILVGLNAIEAALPVIWQSLREFGSGIAWLVDLVGGWENAAIGLGVVLAGPLLAAIAGVLVAVTTLGGALWASGIAPIVLGIAAIAGAAALIITKWSEISDWISGTFASAIQGAMDKITGIFSTAWDFIGGIVDRIKGGISWVGSFAGFGGGDANGAPIGRPTGAPITGGTPLQRGGDMSGRLDIHVDSEGRATIGKVETNNLDLNIDRGFSMVGP